MYFYLMGDLVVVGVALYERFTSLNIKISLTIFLDTFLSIDLCVIDTFLFVTLR